jgi:hypothetical protein
VIMGKAESYGSDNGATVASLALTASDITQQSAIQPQAARLQQAAAFGENQANTDTTLRQNIKTTFDNIDLARGFSDDLFDDGGRLAPNGGSGIYSGGEYDNFRRSENVEDRRKQKYSQNPSTVTRDAKLSVEVGMRNFTDDLLRGTTSLSQELGINDLR